jgi:murein L,D-transpeptidase YcbB/YkuD
MGTKSLRLGDSSSTIRAIRERLYELNDLSQDSKSARFDAELEEGVKNYQFRMGMKTDGIIGANLIRKINIPINQYIQQIIVNMERSRWVPVTLTGDYLVVNIPAFQLFSFESDSLAFVMNVVVGKSVHRTVIFNGDLKYVVFSPYWNVPPDIMQKEAGSGKIRITSRAMIWNGMVNPSGKNQDPGTHLAW